MHSKHHDLPDFDKLKITFLGSKHRSKEKLKSMRCRGSIEVDVFAAKLTEICIELTLLQA
jgi:hypothetical protein